MQITHEEAQRLIQLAFDEPLEVHQQRMLDSHLALCIDCTDYANDMQQMESILRPLLKRQWAQPAVPLPIETLMSRPNSRLPEGLLLATRIALAGVMFVVFMLSIWQLGLPRSSAAGPAPASVPPIPVPLTSTKLVSTKMQSQVCKEVIYIVEQNDTLASIATKFMTSQKDILSVNNLESKTVITGMEIIIPVCSFTPTETVSTLTTTFTPILHTITSTPGG